MRAIILPLLVAALPSVAAKPEKFFVVVHTTDKVLVKYICNNDANKEDAGTTLRSLWRSNGDFMWHVVGGTAPYTVVSRETDGKGGCITVMDANGNTATGCGVIATQIEKVYMDCDGVQRLKPGPYGIVPNDSTHVPKPYTTEPRPETYVPPVKTPAPEVNPPVHPKPAPDVLRPERVGPDGHRPPPRPGPLPRNVQPAHVERTSAPNPPPPPRPAPAPPKADPIRNVPSR